MGTRSHAAGSTSYRPRVWTEADIARYYAVANTASSSSSTRPPTRPNPGQSSSSTSYRPQIVRPAQSSSSSHVHQAPISLYTTTIPRAAPLTIGRSPSMAAAEQQQQQQQQQPQKKTRPRFQYNRIQPKALRPLHYGVIDNNNDDTPHH